MDTDKINLNIMCKVTLTEEGAQAENRQRERMNAALPSNMQQSAVASGDRLEAPLWRLFNTFGFDLFNGASPTFEGNLIEMAPKEQA